MSRKSKGTNAERELIRFFWNTGDWAAMRAAGSGSSRYPCPDILAGNNIRKLAIECKTSKNNNVYLQKKEILELGEFAKKFGAESWVGIRFDKNDWCFLSLEDIKSTEKGFSISAALARRKGLLFEEMIGLI